jgi:hypothetical protein
MVAPWSVAPVLSQVHRFVFDPAQLLEGVPRPGTSGIGAPSSGAPAGALGRRDGMVTRQEAIDHAGAIVAATDLPVSADLEKGFRRRTGGCPTGLRKTTYLRRFSTSTPSRARAATSASENPRARSTALPCSLKRGGALRVPPGVRDSFIGVPRPR